MNDNLSNFQKDRDIYSLRQRYLFVSSIIVVMIFAFAWLAQSYVSRNSHEHRQGIERRQQASHKIHLLRDELMHVEKGLEAYMWRPSPSQRQSIHHAVDSATLYLRQLQQDKWFVHNTNETEVGDFELDLKALHTTLDRVMDMRSQNRSQPTEGGNYSFNQRHTVEHFKVASEALRQGNDDITMQLVAIDQLWQQLLGTTHLAEQAEEFEPLAASQRADALHRQLNTLIEGLMLNPELADDTERQQLLATMLEAGNLWLLNFKEQLYSQEQGRQQDDIYYLKHTVEPQFAHLWDYIATLEQRIDDFTKHDTTALTEVANTVAKVVWLLSFIGLTVITIAYIYFQRTILQPIATMARALKTDADGGHVDALPRVHNLETHHLIEAYSEMRRQVQDRQQALEHIAMHDSLTGLPNRYQLMGSLQALCDTSGKEGASFAVMMLGLDRFKEVNDTLGQQTGDDILKKFGQRLRTFLRGRDNVARFASDEFAILLHHTGDDEALHVARKIRSDMEQPFNVDGLSLSISCSIGIALFPEHGTDREELTRRANIAMATAKHHKTGIALYDERYDTSSVERISLAGKLREAIAANRLQLNYQPQFAVHNNRLSGLEVLCRWEDAESGPISPSEFIPVAEQTGQIHALSEWVIEHALEQAKTWREKGLDCGILSINISAFNLHAPNFISMLEQQLKRWEFPASRLMLEITETAMMADPDHAIKTMGELHELGLKLSIDDYGTGFSSLAYVKQLPIDELKIDKSFVMDMTYNENDAVIVRSTIDLAHNLGLKVVAEGVDTQEKRDLLEILDCDFLQGFHIGRPLPAMEAEEILPLLEQQSKVRHLRDFR